METSSQTELDTTPISGTMIGTMPKAFHKPTAYILLMLVTAIWGSTFLITKHALHLTSPFTFLSLRFAVATIFLMLAFHRRLRRLTAALVWRIVYSQDLRISSHERTRPDAAIGVDFPRAGGFAVCRRRRARLHLCAFGRRACIRSAAADHPVRDGFRGRASC